VARSVVETDAYLAGSYPTTLWTRTVAEQDWKRVIFTDEVPLQLGEDISRRWTIRAAGEEYEPQHFHVWGAMAYGKKWPLVRLPLAASVSSGGKRKKAEGDQQTQ
jgi:hypothetical protein